MNIFYSLCVLSIQPGRICPLRTFLILMLPEIKRSWHRLHLPNYTVSTAKLYFWHPAFISSPHIWFQLPLCDENFLNLTNSDGKLPYSHTARRSKRNASVNPPRMFAVDFALVAVDVTLGQNVVADSPSDELADQLEGEHRWDGCICLRI